MNRPLPTQALSVKEIGSFHVGGRQVTLSGLGRREFSYTEGAPSLTVDPNGDFEVEQLYVQYVRLSDPRGKYPLLLWHGGGMSGVTWETTPDGRHGWQMFFLRAGHDVYVSDAVERGRAGWARYPEVFEAEPFFRTKKEAWELFRVGPIGSYVSDAAKRSAHAGPDSGAVRHDRVVDCQPEPAERSGPVAVSLRFLCCCRRLRLSAGT